VIILQSPRGNLGFHLIRATYHRWPDHFNYTGLDTWKNQNSRPDVVLANPHMISESELQELVRLLTVPSMVMTANIDSIPALILNQVPSSKRFRIVLDTPHDRIKNMFSSWLGDINNQFDYADAHKSTVDLYQNLWQQLCVHLLDMPESQQGTAITDLGSYDGISGFLDAVQSEFLLENPAISLNDYNNYLADLHRTSLVCPEVFPDHYQWFSDICTRILDTNSTSSQYQQVLDTQMQQRFRTIMDFFIFKRNFWDWSPEIYGRWNINWGAHFPT
jgi:hypothetical protein